MRVRGSESCELATHLGPPADLSLGCKAIGLVRSEAAQAPGCCPLARGAASQTPALGRGRERGSHLEALLSH